MFRVLFMISLISTSIAKTEQKTGNYLPQESDERYSHQQQSQAPGLSTEECIQRIYRDCNFPTTFSDEELENVRQFLNYSFTVLADIKPDKPLCPKLHVRQDWKCLSQQQKRRITNVWKEMYRRGDVQRLTDIHVKYWPAWHKSGEFIPSHRWLGNEFEKAMMNLDPQTTLPYWDPYTCGTQPERSSIWDTLGHSGNYSNGYSVPDGIYGEWGLIPTMKRHWSPRGTIYPWFAQEFLTSYIQSRNAYPNLGLTDLSIHFAVHLNIGGYEGQFSIRTAPYDVLFFLYHNAFNSHLFKWQLLNRHNLTPLSQSNFRFNPSTGILENLDIRTATLTGVPSVTLREMFWIGFGENCDILDQMVRPINNLWNGIRDPIPTAVKRLPQWIIRKYFPLFNSGNFTAISHTFEEVGDCNTVCHPIPRQPFMNETEAGRLQFEAFRYDGGFDQYSTIINSEQFFYNLWLDLKRSGYCSPYVTTY